MDEAFGVEPRRQAQLVEQVDGALLEDARPDAMLDVGPVARLEHDRVDARP